jgi:hypothetical protein
MKIELQLKLGKQNESFFEYCSRIYQELKNSEKNNFVNTVLSLRKVITTTHKINLTNKELELLIAKSIMLDLITQGWKLTREKDRFFVEIDNQVSETNEDSKSRIRESHIILRNQQLLSPSVNEFVTRCERRRLFNGEWHSIFSLMRDGEKLSQTLKDINKIDDPDQRFKTLSNEIKPYIQFAEAEKVCELTGIPLLEIWRYFRHTWVTPYKVLPGRSVAILIRDSAAPNHPVIGIGALGSSVAQFAVRDKWIGWDAKTFVEELIKDPTTTKAKYLVNTLDEQIKSLYKKDLFQEGILKKVDLESPSKEIVKKLRTLGDDEIVIHRSIADHSVFNNLKKNKSNGNADWGIYANTSLYKSKRFKALSVLLAIKSTFNKYQFTKGTRNQLSKALVNSDFREAVGQLIRKIKSESLGIKMMDIIICGAIPPYNALLGGKLVCSLLASPEVTKYYKNKYRDSASIIASSMHGKKIFRKQDLVLLGTTSLYSVGSSQYNRIKIPASEMGGSKDDQIEYINLGLSEGFGSFHFSQDTIDFIHTRLGRKENGRVVNSIFGEGANPLLRKMREGLDIIGFPSEQLLKHGYKRVVYGVPLAKNFKEILIGFEKRPRYLIPQVKPKLKTQLMANYWIKRWLMNRITNYKVLEEVAKHTLDYPIIHGAKVPEVVNSLDLQLFT